MTSESSGASAPAQDDGFTLVELLVALTIIGGVLVAMAFLLTGSLGAFAAAQQRSGVVEVANGYIESLRATTYDKVGVLSTDPNYSTAYPGTKFGGRDAVVVASGAPAAVETITTSPAKGVPVPLTVERWITWTDASGGAGHQFKRLDVRLTWTENGSSTRRVALTSLFYPGGLGTSGAAVGNQTPTASFTYSPTAPPMNTSVQFTSTSTDPDSDLLSYVWTFHDGSSSTSPTPTFTFTSSGSFVVLLTVSDGRGGTASKTESVTVTSTNTAPSANFTIAPLSGRNDVINVDASSSSDIEGGTLQYAWTFGDGGVATGMTAQHAYLAVGTYQVTLTVTDSGDKSGTKTLPHTVNAVGCTVIDGSFQNPSTNATKNRIVVDNQGKPISTGFRFSGITTSACPSLGARVPKANGQAFASSLALVSDDGSRKIWTATATVDNNDKFSLGTAQTGFFDSPPGAASARTYPFSFAVVPQ